MSILGYSASYFLPEYWSSTPLYGEKIIPLLDYILSTDYEESNKLAEAFYAIDGKYKNPADLSIGQIEDLIDESGYSYIKELLGDNEESIRLLVNLIVLIHQLKGTKLGIYVVLNLLRRDTSILTTQVVGNPVISPIKDVSGFTEKDYLLYTGFEATGNTFEIGFKVGTGSFNQDQCIMSIGEHGALVTLATSGALMLSLGSNRRTWNIVENKISSKSLFPNSEYFIRLKFDGYEYQLQVSQDGDRYETFVSVETSESLGIIKGLIYVGVDGSGAGTRLPFKGYINYSNFSIDVSNIDISTWFEQVPVAAENTFFIKTELDIELVSSDFFQNFSKFISKYVYPSLTSFEATLTFTNKATFIPIIRNRVVYIAQGDLDKA